MFSTNSNIHVLFVTDFVSLLKAFAEEEGMTTMHLKDPVMTVEVLAEVTVLGVVLLDHLMGLAVHLIPEEQIKNPRQDSSQVAVLMLTQTTESHLLMIVK